MKIRYAALSLSALFVLGAPAAAEDKVFGTLYKNPGCTCCDRHASYLEEHGFEVTVVPSPDLQSIRKRLGVPKAMEGCHVMVVDGYLVEGHVPYTPIKRMLAEKPKIIGISLPGMPAGSPGMDGNKEGPFEVLAITADGEPAQVYAVE
jgi:hypothetical protein